MSFADIFHTTYGIVPDPLFVRMHDDHVLSYETSDEWRATYQVRAITNPPALLINPSIEWQDDSSLLAWQTPRHWRKDITFVAFAHEGGGDDWCWVPNWMERSLPVVYTPHDLNQAQMYAPDFESFLLRAFLETLVEFPNSSDLRTIEANRRTLEPYIRPKWNQVIREITSRQPTLTAQNTRCFITSEALAKLVREQFQYEHLDKTFAHMA